MKIDSITGLLDSVRYLPSPHCDERPNSMAIDLVVIHGISLPPGQFGQGAIEKFFCGHLDFNEHPYFATLAALRVSAHLLITRQGDIIQFVPFTKRAWHAGQSVFAGREQCNNFSIGIELEGTDDMEYEKIQYEQLAKVLRLLMKAYPGISRKNIVGHSDIAPSRKTDPGPAFHWNELDSLLESTLSF
jgi:AmpD protein